MSRRRQRQDCGLAVARRDYRAHQEHQARARTRKQSQRDPQPWYLPELGLTRDCWQTCPARGELPPVVRRRR
ncbi:hypothetical protein [Deinococcus sp. YIM 77859]|uniref:hypothetical protein n=1 Tax=Deinococcus sp. YIM 77859 TaxID=1540221 RepID=UPI000554FE83|nr:hypothetical protein [Deinococcus sp. YIM 77859]